jgi:cytoskeletal protein CcmA (bactofilin family)
MIKKDKNSLPSQNATFIANVVEINGTLKVSNIVHIEGKVNGDIETVSGAQSAVFIRKGGEVKGNVSASTVIVSGRLEGEIRADEHLEIHAEAVVIGDMYYRSLEMTDGARVNGTLNCLDEIAELSAGKDREGGDADDVGASVASMRARAAPEPGDDEAASGGGDSFAAEPDGAPGAPSRPRR